LWHHLHQLSICHSASFATPPPRRRYRTGITFPHPSHPPPPPRAVPFLRPPVAPATSACPASGRACCHHCLHLSSPLPHAFWAGRGCGVNKLNGQAVAWRHGQTAKAGGRVRKKGFAAGRHCRLAGRVARYHQRCHQWTLSFPFAQTDMAYRQRTGKTFGRTQISNATTRTPSPPTTTIFVARGNCHHTLVPLHSVAQTATSGSGLRLRWLHHS